MNKLFFISTTTVSMLAGALLVSSCASVPKPAVPDGSTRTPVNDATRLAAFQQSVTQDRAAQTENSQLRAHIDMLRGQVEELRSIVREALLLPPAATPVIAPTVTAPSALNDRPTARLQAPLPLAENAPSTLPPHVLETSSSAVVVRVFHAFSQSQFTPTEQVAELLKQYSASAEAIQVRAMTDSPIADPGNRAVASARAAKAATWLVSNGAKPSRIRTEYYSAGRFLADNSTREGRALNRRVEIEFRGGLAGVSPPFVAAEKIIVRSDSES
jgi:outer membrane protein OmpA-like peptidoglycan-associated protein